MKKNYYVTCPECGAHLDPGEACDCARKRATLPGQATERCAARAEDIRRMREAGMSFERIAQDVGVSPTLVRDYMQHHMPGLIMVKVIYKKRDARESPSGGFTHAGPALCGECKRWARRPRRDEDGVLWGVCGQHGGVTRRTDRCGGNRYD